MEQRKIRKPWISITLAFILAVGFCFFTPGISHANEPMKVYYNAGFTHSGWSRDYQDNTLCVAPQGTYLTALKASLNNQPERVSGTIAYQVNLSGSGWLDWTENYGETGALDGDMPLEAVRVHLTGDLGEQYDVYYAVLQHGSWTSWVMNEETAGTEGAGLRIDGIKIAVVIKGAGEPPATQAGKVDPNRPMVALTFDDGPLASVTNRVLNSLQAYGGRATFFVVGSRVPGNASVINRMIELGCEVGNHTNDHKYLPDIGDGGIRSQVGVTNQKVAAACGVTPTTMRPPGGNYNRASLNTLASMGMSCIMWSIDTRDWQTRNAQKTISSVLNNVQDGDIVLMHDIYGATADAAEVIIPELTARGYQLVTVSEMAMYRGGLRPGQVYTRIK